VISSTPTCPWSMDCEDDLFSAYEGLERNNGTSQITPRVRGPAKTTGSFITQVSAFVFGLLEELKVGTAKLSKSHSTCLDHESVEIGVSFRVPSARRRHNTRMKKRRYSCGRRRHRVA
jgi:hypothetical protein